MSCLFWSDVHGKCFLKVIQFIVYFFQNVDQVSTRTKFPPQMLIAGLHLVTSGMSVLSVLMIR